MVPIILLLVYHLLFVAGTSGFPSNSSLPQVLHPTQECLANPPVNIFYYSFLFTVDTPVLDYCSMNMSGCSSLCDNNLAVNIKSTSNLDMMTGLINYCLYCNTSESLDFRAKLLQGECSSFLVKEENLGSKIYEIMEYHCGDSNIPLLDMSFLNTEYFRRNIYSSSNQTISWGSIISMYFSKYLVNDYKSLNPPLDIPILCWCNYSNSNSPTFSHQCFDVNSNFLMYSYRVSPLLFTIVFFLLFVFHFIFLVLPKFTERIIKLKRALLFEYQVKSPSFKVKYSLLHFIDISVHPPVFFSVSLLFAGIENFVRVLSNYAFFYEYYSKFFVGVFRGLGGICGLIAYSSLVIQWSHSIDLANTKKVQPLFLSRINLIILGLVYAGVFATLITLFAVFITIDQNSAYIVLSCSTLIYIMSFFLGFLIYGFKMIHKLRATNIWEYKFTKFIVSLSILSTIVWIFIILTFITFSLGFDIFGTFFGIARNIIMDLCILSMTILSSYITINEDGFKKLYGQKLYQFITCSLLPYRKSDQSIPSNSSTNFKSSSNQELVSNKEDV